MASHPILVNVGIKRLAELVASFADFRRGGEDPVHRALRREVGALTHAHVIEGETAEAYRLGIITMKLLVEAGRTNGAFSLGEFSGGVGAWTVPHIHDNNEESSMCWTVQLGPR